MDKALQTMIDNMPDKTGKTLEQWLSILANEKIEKHGIAVKYLKTEHGLTHGYANTIVSLSRQQEDATEDLVASQYKGKENLQPIYQKLLEIVNGFGSDSVITPKKTTVSIIRKHQYALIKPATKKRLDLGLKLKGVEPQGKLENSGPFGTMCTHRIQLHDIDDIDDEVQNWLLTAYNMSV